MQASMQPRRVYNVAIFVDRSYDGIEVREALRSSTEMAEM